MAANYFWLRWKIYDSSTRFIRPYLYLQTVLEVKRNKEDSKLRRILQLVTTQLDILPTPQLLIPTDPGLQLRLYCFYNPKVFTAHELSSLILKPHIQSLHPEKPRVYRK